MDNINEITLVRITPNDIPLLQQLGRQTFYETFSATNTAENMQEYLGTAFTEERLMKELSSPDSESYFAMMGDRAIGYVKVNFGPAQTELQDNSGLELERIYVLLEFQGAKVGQLLFNKAVQIAKDRQLDYLWLGVWEKNEKALGFYKRNGFVQFGSHAFKLGTDEQTDLMMKLLLK
jgi:ribosomal protein S18 acetylase RimI-like enzyme